MGFERILITGGAGFVGSNLALACARELPGVVVTCFDNLARRGSELALPRLQAGNVTFVRGDVRDPEALAALPDFDLLIDCAAEASVLAGLDGSPAPLVENNLFGTSHCLELARVRGAALLFLSSSRVYPIAPLNDLPFEEGERRYEWTLDDASCGVTKQGVLESFPLAGTRSLYGATKLASELLLQEYAASYDVPVLIDRCGVLSGPWQMGRVDQGFAALWMARHVFGGPLAYHGFDGQGKQVRDLLHVDDLFELVRRQLERPELWDGRVYNVGGGREISCSLRELTELCRELTGRRLEIGAVCETHAVDLRVYLSDAGRARSDFDWTPRHGTRRIAEDLLDWMRSHEDALRPIFR